MTPQAPHQLTASPAILTAEAYLVGSLLLEGDRTADVAHLVQPDNITDRSLRRLYAAIVKLHRAGLAVEPAAILRECGADESLADMAAELRGGIGSAANAVHYAGMVREAAGRRDAAQRLHLIAGHIEGGRESLESQIGLARGVIDSLSAQGLATEDTPLMTAAAFLSRPAPRWLVPGVIPDAGFGLLVGPPGSGKSFFALELALAIATGRPLLHRDALAPTRTGWVAVLLGESLASWSARLRAACSFHQVEPDGLMVCDRPPALGDPAAFSSFSRGLDRETRRRGAGPVLVIVDTLSACSPGVDENSASDVGVVVAHLQQLVAGGACVIALHHPGKSGNTYRGSSALLGSADFLLRLDKDGRTRTLAAEKLRDAETIADVAFELVPHDGSAVVRSSDAPTATWIFNTADPDLRAVLHQAGYRLPGDLETAGALQGDGLSLRELAAAWGALVPITPTRSESRTQNDAARYRREAQLLRLAQQLVTAGALRVKSGTLSAANAAARTESMRAVVWQVSNAS